MKIDIDLKSDSTIRNQVKEIIEGQVKLIIREEFKDLLTKEIKNILFNWNNVSTYNNPFYNGIKEVVEKQIGLGWDGKLKVQTYINKFLEDNIDKWIPNNTEMEAIIKKELKRKILSSIIDDTDD